MPILMPPHTDITKYGISSVNQNLWIHAKGWEQDNHVYSQPPNYFKSVINFISDNYIKK